MFDVTIRPMEIDRDCEGVAALFNASNPGWPGGFTEGIPFTTQLVREWVEEERNLVIYLAEAGGQIVGYCTFMENTPWPSGLYGAGYLGLLNVHPDYHGRSIGRRLLTATIERSVQEGWARQTLGTWSANFKSVPAYKRTGHFWRPDSAVWMENFVPGALQMPLAKPFFARHDWYANYVRKIEQTPDDQRWEGLKVYTQHWEADGESLTIWIDREALAPCAIETDEVAVAAIAQDLEPLQGSEATIRWRIQNKRAEPLRVHIHALGADGLEIDHREGFVVPPGLSVEHVAQVKVTDKAPKAKLDGSAPAVRSIVSLDHDEVELFSGMRPRKPLSLGIEPEPVTMAPGCPMSLGLALHSELDAPLAGTLTLMPPEGVTVDWREQQVTLEAKGYLRLPVTVQAAQAGVHTLHARLAPQGDAAKPLKEDLTLFCLAAGGVLAHHAGDSVRLETDTVRLNVAARNGSISLEHKEGQINLLTALPLVGPPYYPGDFDKNHFDLRLEQRDGRAVVRMSAEPQFYPDTRLELAVALAADGLVTVEQQLENRGAEPFTRRLALRTRWQNQNRALLTTPLQAGYVQAPANLYPKHGDDAPRDPEAYAEPWIATQQQGAAAGVAWAPGVAWVEHTYSLCLHSPLLNVAPGERSPLMRYALWAGSGDWRAAREHLVHWAGNAARGQEPPRLETRPVAHARLERPVLATVDDAVTSDLIVDSVSVRKLDGEVRIEGAGLAPQPATLAVGELSRERSLRQPATLAAPKAVGSAQGAVHLELLTSVGVAPFAVLRLGTRRDVHVAQGEAQGQAVWTVDNGATQLTVAPTFGPSAISWLWQGQEMLESPFPTPRGYCYEYPWYGGIQLNLRMHGDQGSHGCLVDDAWAAEAVSVTDAQGLPWRGVRLSARPQRKELHDLLVSYDYMTLGDSPVLKVVYRLENLRPTRQQVVIGGVAALRLGAALEQLVLQGERARHLPSPWSNWHTHTTWGLLTEPQSGRSALGVCPQGKLALVDNGHYGRLFELYDHVTLEGDATLEVVLYLALAESPQAAETFRGLAEL
jgi:GNAT superfamily N-acetyltransferase